MTKNDESSVKMKNFLNSDRELIRRVIFEHLNLPKTIIRKIMLENLETRKSTTKFVPKMLTESLTCQKDVSETPWFCIRDNPNFIEKVITEDV